MCEISWEMLQRESKISFQAAGVGPSRRTGHGGEFWQTWSTGEGNGKLLQCSCPENPMNSMKRGKDRTLKNELPRSVGTQYAIRVEWRNNSRKNEETKPKRKQSPVVDVIGDGSKVQCWKEQYCIGTWNVRSMNHGKLKVVKQEMAGVYINILGIRELKWTGWANLIQMFIISTTVAKNPLEEIEKPS